MLTLLYGLWGKGGYGWSPNVEAGKGVPTKLNKGKGGGTKELARAVGVKATGAWVISDRKQRAAWGGRMGYAQATDVLICMWWKGLVCCGTGDRHQHTAWVRALYSFLLYNRWVFCIAYRIEYWMKATRSFPTPTPRSKSESAYSQSQITTQAYLRRGRSNAVIFGHALCLIL
jgi:hypothetical protein